MDYGMDNGTTDIMDVCSITLDKGPCGVGLPSDLDLEHQSVVAPPCPKWDLSSTSLSPDLLPVDGHAGACR